MKSSIGHIWYIDVEIPVFDDLFSAHETDADTHDDGKWKFEMYRIGHFFPSKRECLCVWISMVVEQKSDLLIIIVLSMYNQRFISNYYPVDWNEVWKKRQINGEEREWEN